MALKEPESLRTVHRSYLANVTYLDDKVGELLEALEAYGLAENTIVLFCSDHGDMLGFRGVVQKRAFYEHSSRIPLLARFPEGHPLRRVEARCDDAVSIVDLVPTMLELAGVADYLPMDGRSLIPQLRGERDPERMVFCENHVDGVTACCFMGKQGRYKLTLTQGDEVRLYDLESDPEEWHNLAEQPWYAPVVVRLRGAIEARFDAGAIDRRIVASLAKRGVIKRARLATGGPSWDYQPFFDASEQYWRSG